MLRTLGCPSIRPFNARAIVTSLILAATPHCTAAQNLDKALADYRAYSLPEAPAGAQLVVAKSSWRSYSADGREHRANCFGLLIEADGADRKAVVLFGTHTVLLENIEGGVTRVLPSKATFENFDSYDMWGMPTGVATAIQCHARGWNDFARKLWKRSIRQHDATASQTIKFWEPKLGDKSVEVVVATLAYEHYQPKLYDYDSDWRPIARKILMITMPTANPQASEYISSLEAALQPSDAKAGSPEELIDNLIESRDFLDPPNKKLAELGFDAIPALIEHVDDNRWTRAFKMGAGPFYPYQVADHCEYILRGLVGEPEPDLEGKPESKIEGADRSISATKVRAWYREVLQVGEEKHLLARVFPDADRPNHVIFWAIAAKYPRHLPELFREFLTQHPEYDPKFESSRIADTIASSRLSAEEKIAVLGMGTKHHQLAHRVAALSAIEKLDRDAYLVQLREAVRTMPRSRVKDHWSLSNLVDLVAESNDDQIKRTLMKIALEGDTELKMRLLYEVASPEFARNWSPSWREYAINFSQRFLGDRSQSVSLQTAFGSLWDERSFAKLAVRDFAALQLGEMLKVENRPHKTWTTREWSDYRERVRRKLDHDNGAR